MHNLKIILVGYRATGKTTIGKLLADRLSFNFIDMDKAIESRENSLIRDLVKTKGWPYFREKEKCLLEELINQQDRLVIATGGGAILHQELWPKVLRAGMVVWLKADQETICRRLAEDALTCSQRPSLTGGGTEQEVASVLAQREPLYKAGSHIAVDTAGKTITEIVDTVLAQYKSRFPNNG
nr:shikimate kinase [Desulfobulbaceae bacterium]